MSKRVYRIAALALALMMLGGAALSEVVTTGSVWLRSAPNLNAEQITSYKEGCPSRSWARPPRMSGPCCGTR